MTYKDAFQSPYEQYAERNGQPFVIVRKITEPTDEIDDEVLPMYEIRFPDDATILAWPEEVEIV